MINISKLHAILSVLIFVMFFTACSEQKETPSPSYPPAVIDEVKPTEISEAIPTPTPTPTPQLYNEYTASLDIDPATRTINGIQKIKYTNTTGYNQDKLYVHLYLNAFQRDAKPKPYFDNFEDKIFQNGQDYGYIDIISISKNNVNISFSVEGTLLTIELDAPLVPEETAELTLQFKAVIPKINHRTGANDYAIWCGNTLPILAVYDSGGWHKEPYYPAGDPFYSEIANYVININTPIDYTVTGTGNISENIYEDTKTTTLTAYLVRDFAFAVGKYDHITSVTTDLGVQISFYSYSNLEAGKVLDLAAKSLDYYSKKIGAYPYQRLEIIECGLFLSGGMEYPGILFMDSDYLKRDAKMKSVAHEIGHQWFYNIVGNDQVNYPWLDEGITMLLQEGIFSDDAALEESMQASYERLASKLVSEKLKSMDSGIKAYDSWSDYYDVNYSRARLMFYALSQKLGHEGFDKFIKEYFSRYAYSIVDKDKLISTAEEIYGEDLQLFFNSWMNSDSLPPLK